MIKFNPKNKKTLTYSECLDPIFKLTDRAEATQYKKDYIEFMEVILQIHPNKQGLTAEQIVNSNIGYYAGYGSGEDRVKIEELFKRSRPTKAERADK